MAALFLKKIRRCFSVPAGLTLIPSSARKPSKTSSLCCKPMKFFEQLMTSTLNYKGYTGTIEIDTDSECLCGQVLFIRGLIVYEADTLPKLRQNFQSAVDEYLTSCEADGTSPEKPASGTFNVRIGPERHSQVIIAAHHADISLNEWMKRAVEVKLLSESEPQAMVEMSSDQTSNDSDEIFEPHFMCLPRDEEAEQIEG